MSIHFFSTGTIWMVRDGFAPLEYLKACQQDQRVLYVLQDFLSDTRMPINLFRRGLFVWIHPFRIFESLSQKIGDAICASIFLKKSFRISLHFFLIPGPKNDFRNCATDFSGTVSPYFVDCRLQHENASTQFSY